MNPNSSIYRGLMKRGKRFMKLPLNLGRRSFLDNSWPFDERCEVFAPMMCCHVVEVMRRRCMNKVEKRKGAGWGIQGTG
ncbi:hypothetical protein Tco_0082211, partial [Tanacetum coccineum]